jgi:hypothetical protein
MPIYKTEQDASNDEAVIERLKQAWPGSEFVQLDPLCRMSWLAVSGGVVIAVIDIRTRNYTMERLDAMGGVMIDETKMREAMTLSRMMRCSALFIVRDASDRIWLHDAKPVERIAAGIVCYAGRTDRGDPRDMDRVFMLKQADFTLVA